MKGRRASPRARWFREDIIAWLLVTAAGSSAVLGSNYWLHRRVRTDDAVLPQAVQNAKLVVLAFDRIVTDPAPNKISRAQLRGHLARLKEAGFVGVSLDAVARFYESGTPLPEKSLLLTFDHGYLSTYEAVDPLLRELDWPAVLFLMTERQQRRDPFFVYWDRVDRMVASGLWQVGSHGHRGHDPIPVDADGTEGPFFIRAMWLRESGRAETWEEFDARVREDHERARSILAPHLGGHVLAYAPPLRDVAGLSAAPEAHELTEELVRSSYRLAFFDDRFGVNDRRSDPKRLKRLRVQPSWGSDELVRRLRFALGEDPEKDLDEKTAEGTAPWFSGSGRAHLDDDGDLVLTGERRTDVWRAGSQWVEDWELEAEVAAEGGEIWVVQESDRTSDQWRFGGTTERTYLQTRSPGERTEVIESYGAKLEAGRWHRLHVIKRGSGLWLAVDGSPLADHPTYLPGRWRGNVGVVHWSPTGAELRLRKLSFQKVPFAARVVPSSLPTEEIQRAIAEAPRLAALSPRWFELDRNGFRAAPVDTDLLRILSHRFGWEIVPTLRVSGVEPSAGEAALDAILSSARPELAGLRVELTESSPEAVRGWTRALEERARRLGWKSGRLLVMESEAHP